MTSKQNTKRNGQQELDVKAELQRKIDAARTEIRKAIMSGGSTVRLREFLKELETEQAKLQMQETARRAAQEAAQQATKQADAQRINEAAKTLADASRNRVAAVVSRFAISPIPDVRSLSHA